MSEHIMSGGHASHAESSALLWGLAGAIAGLGANLSGFTVAGAEPIGAASPMVMALTGAAIGAMVGGLIGALTEEGAIQAHVGRFAESVRGWTARRYSPAEAERERRQFGAHADSLTGLPLTADPELDNALETTIRR